VSLPARLRSSNGSLTVADAHSLATFAQRNFEVEEHYGSISFIEIATISLQSLCIEKPW
jgi:hypothetical protein